MSGEEKKDNSEGAAEAPKENKPAARTTPVPAQQAQRQVSAAQGSQPQTQAGPRPVTTAQPRPPAPPVSKPPVPPPSPPSRPPRPKSEGRRNFIKVLVTIGAFLSIIPFVPWGDFLSSSVSSTGKYTRQKVILDANQKANGAVAGRTVNVNDLNSFPPNSHWLITYPSSGDLAVDAQNPDTFVKYDLIRLPTELGGSNKDATAFVAFSKVCVHLWCSPSYDPSRSTNPAAETYQCPCHGSIYRVPDGLSIQGPASLQPPPTNAIPMLTLSADKDGTLYIEPPIWDVDHNGVIGYGRYFSSYKNYILPAAKGGT